MIQNWIVYSTYSELKGYRHQIKLVRSLITRLYHLGARSIRLYLVGKSSAVYVKNLWPAVGLTLSFKFMRVKPPQNYQLYVKILRFKNQEFLLRWLTICSAFNSFWFCFYTRRRCLPADIYNALDSLLALRNSLVRFFTCFNCENFLITLKCIFEAGREMFTSAILHRFIVHHLL